MSFLFVDALTRFSEDIIRVSKVGFVRLCRSVFLGEGKNGQRALAQGTCRADRKPGRESLDPSLKIYTTRSQREARGSTPKTQAPTWRSV